MIASYIGALIAPQRQPRIQPGTQNQRQTPGRAGRNKQGELAARNDATANGQQQGKVESDLLRFKDRSLASLAKLTECAVVKRRTRSTEPQCCNAAV